ncbi:MAG TPA: contact-dependent growth inhibition system immunity protein [Chryseolinea sp.]|nr:contact-dependent growth inhibition system immunity protein [Chryseolinea sp.]
MTLENNWRYKSLESLEKKNYGPVPADESSIVKRLWTLRKVAINEFTIDDIRFMILQGIGLKYLLILAIELLESNLLTEGNYYEGDLLNAVLSLSQEQWELNNESWGKVDELLREQIPVLRSVTPKLNIAKFYSGRSVN